MPNSVWSNWVTVRIIFNKAWEGLEVKKSQMPRRAMV